MKEERKVVVDRNGIVIEVITGDGPVILQSMGYVNGSTSMMAYDWDD